MTKQEKIEQAKALHCEGFSAVEISEKMGVSERTVFRYLSTFEEQKEHIVEEPATQTERNRVVDRQLLGLFQQGQSTTFNCLGVIANVHKLTLSVNSDKAEAKMLLTNATRRLRRRGEFAIIPPFIYDAIDAEKMLTAFYEQCEQLWMTLEQAIDSLAENHFDKRVKTRTMQQLRYEISKAICLPHATKTAREQAQERHELYYRLAEIVADNKQGMPITNIFSLEQTRKQQKIIEEQISINTGIVTEDIPY